MKERGFASLEGQNEWLWKWEENWAARRMYGVVNLARRHEQADIEAMAGQALAAGLNSYRIMEQLLEARKAERTTGEPSPDFCRQASWRRVLLAFGLTVDDKRPGRPDEL